MDDSTSPHSFSPIMDVPLSSSYSSHRPKPYDFAPSFATGGNVKSSFGKSGSGDLAKFSDMSIRKTAIDWRLVKKEAEAIRLRTENQRLQALLRVNTEELERCKIEHKMQLDENHLKALAMQNKTTDLEDQINELKNNLSVLKIEKARSEETLRHEIEFNEKKLTESQVNDFKMRSQIVDLEEEIKMIHLKNDQSTTELKHELQTLKIELDSARREKDLYLATVNEYKSKIEIITQLESKINELQLKNRVLENTIRDFKDGKSMSFILDNELRELERLRVDHGNLMKENNDLKAQIQSMTNVIDQLTHQASTSGTRGGNKSAARTQTEIYVEELSGSFPCGTSSNENLIQVEFDDEVSVSESMDNSELEIEPTDELDAVDSADQGRPPQRRGRMNDPEGSIHSASDEESDKDGKGDQANEAVTSTAKRRERASSDEESNGNNESSSSCDDEDEDEDEEEEESEESDDSDIQEIND